MTKARASLIIGILIGLTLANSFIRLGLDFVLLWAGTAATAILTLGLLLFILVAVIKLVKEMREK